MKRLLIVSLVAALGLVGVAALDQFSAVSAESENSVSATRQVSTTFAVANMTCALCPITVRKAMKKVAGVTSVEVNFDAKTATVVFDPAVAAVDDIAAASGSAGYPAKPIEG